MLYACLRLGAVVVVADAGLGVQGLTRAVRAPTRRVVIGIERALVAARWLRWAPTLVSAGPLRAGRGPRPAASTRRWTTSPPSAAPRPTTSRGPTPTPTRRSCSPPGRPARPRASSTRTAGSPRCATRSARTYGIGPDSPLVAAFAPFVLLGPALGATSASPDMDVTSPGTLTARALAEAVRAIDARGRLRVTRRAALTSSAPPTGSRADGARGRPAVPLGRRPGRRRPARGRGGADARRRRRTRRTA